LYNLRGYLLFPLRGSSVQLLGDTVTLHSIVWCYGLHVDGLPTWVSFLPFAPFFTHDGENRLGAFNQNRNVHSLTSGAHGELLCKLPTALQVLHSALVCHSKVAQLRSRES